MLTNSLVDVQGLAFCRDDRVIYRDIDMRIPKGKITGIMGPSGIGKTTLLRLIGGQLRPDKGDVLFDGMNVHRLSRDALFRLRRRMGMLFQSGALFSDMNVFENIAFPIRIHTRLSESFIRDLVLMKLEAVGLRGVQDKMPGQLSGGMARRAALARAIALDPDLVMYDEPFAGQDPIAMGVVQQLIKRLNDAMGLTSIVVSHDVNETAQIADYLYIIADAGVIAQGPPTDVLNNPSPQVQQFLQGLPDGPVRFHHPAPSLEEDFQLAAKSRRSH